MDARFAEPCLTGVKRMIAPDGKILDLISGSIVIRTVCIVSCH